MGNITIHAHLVNGNLMPFFSEEDSSKQVVLEFTGDDTGAPPRSLSIIVRTESGRRVEISIPYDSSGNARVEVDNVTI